MTTLHIIQIVTGTLGTLGFGILFNIRGKRLIGAALGGVIASVLYVVLGVIIDNEPLVYFIVAALVTVYSETSARIIKTPATPITITSLIPLIPGGSLYYTMAYAFQSDFETFLNKAVSTLLLAAALALGIIIATAVWRFCMRCVKN